MLNMVGISKHVIQHAGNAQPVKFYKPLLNKEAINSLKKEPRIVVIDLFATPVPVLRGAATIGSSGQGS